MLGARFIALATLLAGTISIAIAEDYIVPTGVTVLTEEQLLSKIVGNTSGNERWDEYFEPSGGDLKTGVIKGKFLKTTYAGNWEVKGKLMCFQHKKAYLQTHDGCYTIALDGNSTTWYKTDGSVWYPRGGRIKLISGNPKNL